VLADKDAERVLEALVPLAASISFTRPASPRSRDPEDLLALLPPAAGLLTEVIVDDLGAFASAKARASRDSGWVVVCGSLYLVGAVRARLF
jgi:dihydrofolate synthase/folylpolyglutamate synthase